MMPLFKLPSLNLRAKIAFSFIGLVALTAALFISVLFMNYRAQMRQNVKRQLREVVAIAAPQVGGDLHAQIQREEDRESAAFQEILSALALIQKAGDDIFYIYTLRMNSDGQITFIVDADEEADPIGTVYENPGPVLASQFVSVDAPVVEDEFYTDEWGTWLSGYAPIYRSDGQLEGVLAIDIAAGDVLAKEQQLLIICGGLIGVILLVAAGLGLLLAQRAAAATREISSLTRDIQKTVAEAVATMDESDRQVDSGVIQSQEAGKALEEILQAVEEVNQQVEQISTAAQNMNQMSNELVSAVDAVSVVVEENAASTRQMAASSSEVSQAIENIASVGEENSAAVEEISASAEEMDMQVEEAARAAQSLADMAHELQGLVSQFNLDAGGSSTQAESGAVRRPANLTSESRAKTAAAPVGTR